MCRTPGEDYAVEEQESAMVNRRTFLAAAAAAGTASSSPKLAVDGGAPVREKPLRAGFYGTQYYDDKEKQELLEVLETRRPFRWYGPGSEPPKKVSSTFSNAERPALSFDCFGA